MDSPTEAWFKDSFRKAWEEQARQIGRFNLALFGKTGVGKSTLVNAIFGESVAQTGIGDPVTQTEHLYLHTSGFLGVLDTRGLEVGVHNEQIIAELRRYVGDVRKRPLEEQLHVAWYCVRASDRRFEETEAAFVRELHELGLPVVLVLTQVPRMGDRYHPDALALADEIAAKELPIVGGQPLMTMAAPDDFNGQIAHGLITLLDATFRAAPDGVGNAINAAQKIDLKRKRKDAGQAIDTACAAAAAAGASPIPFSDAVLLVPIQIGMMASIASTYDISVEKATFAALATTTAATNAGRSAVTNLVKFVPGYGTIVGGAISAGVAAGLTYAMGHAWTLVCERISTGQLEAVNGLMDSETIRRVFMDEFKAQAKKRGKTA